MTAPEAPDRNVRRRMGPRQRIGAESPREDTASLHELRQHTAHLSNRLPLPSLEGMRAGTVLSPQGLVRRYLLSARGIGLPKEWGQRFAVWVQRQVDCLWPMEQTALQVLEQRAMRCEGADDLAEKQHDLERNAITLRERITSLTNEVVADQLCLARLEREMAELAR